MSAGNFAVNRDMMLLAPKFREAVELAIADCQAKGFDAYVYEGYRSLELQQHYYARGRTIVPPHRTVTNASSNLYSWHGYCLAVDVISRSRGWNESLKWFEGVAGCFKSHGLCWGGDWKMRDLPHFQWGSCKPSPSDRAREVLSNEGLHAVWQVVGAY